MTTKRSDFAAFLRAMRGQRLLYLGHRDADCDALGSAYALSRVLPGEVGLAEGLKTSARDLAAWLGVSPLLDPDPADYDYTVICDTLSRDLLGVPLPAQYALFDHHVPGGHRYAAFHSDLLESATWAWVLPFDSTCSVVAEQLLAHSIPIERDAAVALAAGMVTDTGWLALANAGTFRRLADVLAPSGLYLEDVLAAIDAPNRRAARRSAVLAALRRVQEMRAGQSTILSARTDSHDHGFAVVAALRRLGADVSVVVFPKGEATMVMAECDPALVERAGLDLGGIAGAVAQQTNAEEQWGTPLFGRVIASMAENALLAAYVDAIARALSRPKA
jgi:nanoRNase/pAp phosphatase (c-di-AMP/oligoRNAs hydrolase)